MRCAWLKRFAPVFVLVWAAGAVWADAYRIGVNDQLDVRVVIWDAADGTTLEMPGASGVYKVDGSGAIAVSLVGRVAVSGMTVEAVSEALEVAMTDYAAVGQTPRVAVAVDTYAPVYLAGQVDKPGVYDFAANLTVHQAVTLAGGLAGVKPIEGEERNFLTARGTTHVLQQELMFLVARRDRIAAEMGGAADLSAMIATADDPTALQIEEAILASRNDLYSHQLDSLETAQISLREALGVLEEKLANGQLQLEAGEAELQREQDLIERGLVAQARAFDGATYVSELQTRLLDIERSILQAKQELQNNERDSGVLLAARQEENVTLMQQVNGSIAQVEAQIQTQLGLMAMSAGDQVALGELFDPTMSDVTYEITRGVGDTAETFAADRNALVQPGDVIEVLYVSPVSPLN